LALLATGDWNAADLRLTEAVEEFGLADIELLGNARAWLEALRGHGDEARTIMSGLTDLAVTEDVQDRSGRSLINALIAHAEHRSGEACALATEVLDAMSVLGAGTDLIRWSWPLACRSAHEANDTAAIERLLALIANYQQGELPPVLHAERELTLARLAAQRGETGASDQLQAAIATMRRSSTPYHLAHGLLDDAEHLSATGRATEALALIDEARRIGEQLGATPLIDRAAVVLSTSQTRASV